MDPTITFNQIKGLSFKVYSPEEIKKISVLEINNVEILDKLSNPVPGGLYDLRLGPNERDEICGSCGLDYMSCAGHAGHINLPIPIFNPVFFEEVFKLLRGTCFLCHRLLAPQNAVYLALYQLQALDHGLVGAVHELAETVCNTSEADDTVQFRLKRKYEELTAGADRSVDCDPVRSVIETRKELLKEFKKKFMMSTFRICPHCQSPSRKLSKHQKKILYKDNPEHTIETLASTGQLVTRELTPLEAREHLRQVWENEKEILQQLYKILMHSLHWENPAIDVFFMTRILVPPSRFRRLIVLKGKKFADSQTLSFKEVLKDNLALIRLHKKMYEDAQLDPDELDEINKLPGKTDLDKYSNAYHMLQNHVHEIFDSDINKDKNKTSKGIKQILEKKEGLFRMNMMGKRVNYAARSVISPDPYINVDEIGLPSIFAMKLTFPEPANDFNAEVLRRAILNGPNVHPGAKLIEMEDGRKIRISPDDAIQRKALAKTLMTPCPSAKILGAVKIVHRHVRNGDMLLLNRQPTLHRPSIMAHKARILPGEKTLRLHYANCKAYNADFDGDEMNAHLPQSLLGKAECKDIVGVAHQYLVPKDGTPLSGLIQDHIVSAVLLTMRGRFFDKDKYHQLVYSAMPTTHKRIKVLPPAILKPKTLWTGKQVVSTIIINLIPESKTPLTLEGKSKISSKNWSNAPAREWAAGGTPLQGDAMSESEVIIRDGELLCGVIDKAHIGPTPYGMIHLVYELYGGEVSCVILTALGRLFTHFLQYYCGFSLGIEDIVVNTKADRKRKRILKTAAKKGLQATAKALDVDDPDNSEELYSKYQETHFNVDDTGLKVLDREMKEVTTTLNNEINEVCLPKGLIKKFPQNTLQLMIESGAKGASVNAMQISGLLGQIELEGRRMPLMLNGSTLPSFAPYDPSPAAGGFVSGRFLTGINPREYFFHCMAGREGLIDTAVKTSRSGYLQRCLVKNLEGVSVQYDHTVRDSDGSVIQFLYGEDGIDPLKTQFLKGGRLDTLAMNYKSVVNEKELEIFKERYDENLSKEKKKIHRWMKKNKDTTKTRISTHVSSESDGNERQLKKPKKCPDPVISSHSPQVTFKSVSERLEGLINDYVSKNPQHILWDQNIKQEKASNKSLSTEQFKDMCYYKTLRALAEPGEAVGMLAAQSIGEPSTQMTLNTFHFAGKGEMNVTLGIPRIREILMTASANIATPTMDLPLRMDIPGVEGKAEKLRLQLSPAALKDVLDSVKIKETISIHNSGQNSRTYVIQMCFLKHSVYKGFVNTTPAKVLAHIENVFIKSLIGSLDKKRKISRSSKLAEVVKDTSSFYSSKMEVDNEDNPITMIRDDGDSSGDDDNDDEDTISSKLKKQRDQEQSYEEPEEDEILPESPSDEESETEPDRKTKIKQEPQNEWEDAGSPNTTEQQNFDYPEIKPSRLVSDVEKATRINKVKCIDGKIYSYDFDHIKQLWCEITLQIKLDSINVDIKSLVEEVINKSNIYSVPKIKKAILIKDNKDGKLMIKTDGVNFLEIFKYADILDLDKAYSNNIHEIAKIYGIEAATQAIRKELVNVFAAYGIQVDPRHLSLVSDFMTSSGQFKPCNRLGMEGHASLLQQMTFETPKNFMVESMLLGVEDKMKSPSASIVVGQLPRLGTGSFSLLLKLVGSSFKRKCF